MSISSISIPSKYSPVYGNIVYQVQSTNQSTKFKFRYVFDIFVNENRIARLKVTPQNSDWGQVDIARILQNYVQSKPLNQGSSNQNEPISQAIWGWLDEDWLKYEVYIGEEYSNTATEEPVLYNGLGSQGDPEYKPTDFRYVFNAVKEWNDGKTFDMSPFYLNTTDLPGQYEYNADDHRFLTNAPRIQYIREGDYQTLAALNFNNSEDYSVSDPIYAAVFEFFDDGNNLLTTGITHNLIVNGGWRYNCSGNTSEQYVYPDYYKKYISYVGVGKPNLVDMGIGVPPTTKYWRVSLHKSNDDAVPPTPTPSASVPPTPTPSPSSLPDPTAPAPASPTPTPSITPSPTSTPPYDCVEGCARYCVYNYSKIDNLNIVYTECETGLERGLIVGTESSICLCTCGAPTRASGSTNYAIINEGACR